MPSLAWYASRLRAMSLGEVMWRGRCAARDAADRYLHPLRTRWASRRTSGVNADFTPGFQAWLGVSSIENGQSDAEVPHDNIRRLLRRADAAAASKLSFFDLEEHHLGDPIDWGRDPKCGKKAPLLYAPLVDYRDYESAGDCKFVWEPNRHHQLVLLGRAYRATGEKRYAEAVVEQLDSWMRQCPHAKGMNWRSALELGIRLINWVWAADMILPADVMTYDFKRKLLHNVYLHLWEIERNYSRGSSAANHLIGEAAGSFIAGSYFNMLPNADRWAKKGREIMNSAIFEQTFPDGGGREQALGYHLFITEFFLLAGLTARRIGRDFPAEFWRRLHAMFSFLGAMGEGGQCRPMFGDNDDGYVLDLDDDPRDPRPWLAVGATLFDDPELKAWAGEPGDVGITLLGDKFTQDYATVADLPNDRVLSSRAWPDAGLYALQSGHADGRDSLSVTFDCGPLGFRSIAAHGHADALSITLRAFGADVLVDPGTYDYFTYPRWREYFRSTRAHNTIAVDGFDQSEMCGGFLWGARANAKALVWTPAPDGGRVTGEHDGYKRLSDPVLHRRTVELRGASRELHIEDELIAHARHEYAFYLHFGERCRVSSSAPSEYEVEVNGGLLTLMLDPRLKVELLHGAEDPLCGWISRGYHRKTPSTTLIGRCSTAGDVRLTAKIEIVRVPVAGVSDNETAPRDSRRESRCKV